MAFCYEILVILVMLTFTAICVAYEMGLASISQSRINVLLRQKKRGAEEASFMKGRMEASLAIAQLGITLAAAIAAATGGAGIVEEFAPYLHASWGISEPLSKIISLIVLIIPFTFVTIVFAELVPKVYAYSNRERVVLRLSPAMKRVGTITYPAIMIMEMLVKKVVGIVTRRQHLGGAEDRARGLHELIAAASLAKASNLLGEREEKIVVSAANLSARRVRDIMLPAKDIYTITAGSSLMDAFLKAHLDMHTRFPVCSKENDPQTIQGYVNFKDMVVALKSTPSEATINGVTRPITRVDEDMSLSHVLEQMMRDKTHIVVVASQKGRVLGMVTLEDIIEQLVGEIEDEFDRLSTRIQPYGSSWIMGGGVPMTTVASTLGLNWTGKFPDGKVPNLIKWCTQKMGRSPARGEVVESDNVRVIARKFRRKIMSEAIVSLIETA
ncbi:MAG: CNNM domain-containing protein [Candidatus Aureabacteria bacterium]|nr:CNNM domain-containing protein [Candidatus Auribacterota bacterium]